MSWLRAKTRGAPGAGSSARRRVRGMPVIKQDVRTVWKVGWRNPLSPMACSNDPQPPEPVMSTPRPRRPSAQDRARADWERDREVVRVGPNRPLIGGVLLIAPALGGVQWLTSGLPHLC